LRGQQRYVYYLLYGFRLAIDDLHDVIVRSDFAKCLTEDGCHMTAFGNEVLADAVVKAIGALM